MIPRQIAENGLTAEQLEITDDAIKVGVTSDPGNTIIPGLLQELGDAQRRPVHLDAEVFDLMTKWIERYRAQAEERYQRLDQVLARMQGKDSPTHESSEPRGEAG